MISSSRIIALCQLIFLISAGNMVYAQLPEGDNFIFDDRIKTVMIYRDGWNLGHPFIELASDQKLILEFDLLGDSNENLHYSFIHCNKEWVPSGLYPSDYLDGFPENPFVSYKRSFNTTTSYYHYVLTFPNEYAKLTLSGNYIISVHREGEPDTPLLTRRFMISENMAGITASSRRADMGAYRDSHQQVDVTVSTGRLRVADPHNEIFTSILQNGRWDMANSDLKADFISPTELRYTSLSEKTLFPGGNEFRQFDIRSFRYHTEFVRDITYDGRVYNVNLLPSENREFKPYFFRNDFNGKYIIGVQEGIDPSTDADYAHVYFTLAAPQPVAGGDIHIVGEMTLWNIDNDNKMIYNPESGAYEGSLFLKQGWYNYEYRFVPGMKPAETRRYFEGNHYEAENEYLILVYFRSRGSRYDRLVGTLVSKNRAG
jgi:hypothetical protein